MFYHTNVLAILVITIQVFVLQFGAVLVVVAVGVTAQPIDELGPECQTGNNQIWQIFAFLLT